MIKKVLFAVITILFLSGLVAAYFYYKQISAPVSKAINAIPSNTAIIIESRNMSNTWEKLSETIEFWNDLVSIGYIKEIDKKVTFLDSLFATNNRVSDLIKTQPTFISIHLTGANSFDFLFLVGLKNTAQIPFVADFIKGTVENGAFSQRIYDQVTINEIRLDLKAEFSDSTLKSDETFSYAFSKGIFIGSFNSLLVEDAIRQLSAGNSLLNSGSSGFKKVMKTADRKADANIYINYKTFPRFLTTFLNSESKKTIRELSILANWTEVDVKIKPNAIMLNGLTFSDDSTDNYLNLFLKQKPQKIELINILPDNTAVVLYFGVSDFPMFYEDYKLHLRNTNKFFDYKKEIDKINANLPAGQAGYDVDIEKSMLSWIDNEFAMVITKPSRILGADPDTAENDIYAVFRTKSVEKTQNALQYLVEDEEEYRNYTIKRINQSDILSTLLGNAFGPIKANFYTIIDDYVIFANHSPSLKSFINANLLESTLLRSIYYNTFSDNISSKANCYFYSNIQASIGLLETFTNRSLSKSIRELADKEHIKKFGGLAIQFSSTNNMFYTNLFLSYNPTEEKTQSLRQVKLDTSISSQPKLMINHYTKEKEIFIQDEANKIYLIDNSGRILWKKQLPGKIISDIYQIDIYKSNKLQLLFNTKTHIYLIDRKGRKVDNYPVKLKTPATNGIAVFDYEKKKEYRILIACNDKKVYNYNKDGTLVKGWEFDKTASTVRAPIRHFSTKGKDYIVIIDQKGKIYVVDRRGSTRVKINRQFKSLANNTYFIDKAKSISKTRILSTDSTGKVFSIYFSGNIDSILFNDFLSTPFFDYKDINNDGVKDYVFLDKNELFVFNRDNSLIHSYIFNRNMSYKPMFFSFPGNITKIGVVSDKSNELFLFNPDGTLSEGFPMHGNTPFSIADINKDKQLDLITGVQDNSIYIYTIIR